MESEKDLNKDSSYVRRPRRSDYRSKENNRIEMPEPFIGYTYIGSWGIRRKELRNGTNSPVVGIP